MDINTFVQKAVGVPYRRDGESFNGWDCWGLFRCFYRHCRKILLTDYRQQPVEESLAAEMIHWRAIPPEEAQPGDGVLFRGEPFHVAIIIGRNRMLHVTQGANTTLENWQSIRWRHQIVGFYSHVVT